MQSYMSLVPNIHMYAKLSVKVIFFFRWKVDTLRKACKPFTETFTDEPLLDFARFGVRRQVNNLLRF